METPNDIGGRSSPVDARASSVASASFEDSKSINETCDNLRRQLSPGGGRLGWSEEVIYNLKVFSSKLIDINFYTGDIRVASLLSQVRIRTSALSLNSRSSPGSRTPHLR